MKYEDILNKKFLEYLKNIGGDISVIDKEEKFFKKIKKILETQKQK